MSGYAYFCVQRGYHQRNGLASGTDAVVWSSYCAICGAWIGHPGHLAPAEDGDPHRKETEQSAPSS